MFYVFFLSLKHVQVNNEWMNKWKWMNDPRDIFTQPNSTIITFLFIGLSLYRNMPVVISLLTNRLHIKSNITSYVVVCLCMFGIRDIVCHDCWNMFFFLHIVSKRIFLPYLLQITLFLYFIGQHQHPTIYDAIFMGKKIEQKASVVSSINWYHEVF